DRRRLCRHVPRQRPRRAVLGRLPHHRHDLDPVGLGWRGHHRRRAAGAAGRGGPVRTSMTDNVIEARGRLKLDGAQRSVNAIDLDIRRGEIFGLLGPNGAGKTTTILMLLGLTETSGGSVSVLGFDPVRQPLEVKRRVGYLPDAVGFYDHLTAR